MSYKGEYFRAWVRHFRRFNPGHLRKVAARFGFADASAESLARDFCDDPSVLVNAVHENLRDAEAWEILRELALQHDLHVTLGGTTRKARKELFDIGMLPRVETREAVLPAAAAAILAPLLPARTTLPTLLGALSEEELATIADIWEVDEEPSRIGLVLSVAERLTRPGIVDELLERLPETDYLGAALVAIELGGFCYWQEVFGYDVEEKLDDSKVVPFMRSEDRETEEDMAAALIEHGVIFRIDETPHAMLTVPEEMWQGIWTHGRRWLAEWVHEIYMLVEGSGAGMKAREGLGFDMQGVLKWLSCEAVLGETEEVTLRAKTSMPEEQFSPFYAVAAETSVMSAAGEQLFDSVLDLPPDAFARQMLAEWSAGYIGASADSALSMAVGLDESWRQIIVETFTGRGEFLPRWTRFQGVESQMTGAGTLRAVAPDDPFEILADEFSSTNRIIRLAKLIFLDLTSTLSESYYYPLSSMAELLQISTAFSIFASTIYALEDSREPLYIPLQRASYLNDTFHASEFEAWMGDILDHLMVPLGIAERSANGEAVRLDTETMRLPSPADTTDHARAELMRELLHDPGLDLRFPTHLGGQLRQVPVVEAGDEIEITTPVEVIRDWIGNRRIVEFDGSTLRVED